MSEKEENKTSQKKEIKDANYFFSRPAPKNLDKDDPMEKYKEADAPSVKKMQELKKKVEA